MSLIRRQTTEAISTANLANCNAPAGPLTPAGKLRSHMNALRHGVRTRATQVIPQLRKQDRPARIANLPLCWFAPEGGTEAALVDQIAETRWRRPRLLRAETSLLTARQVQCELIAPRTREHYRMV